MEAIETWHRLCPDPATDAIPGMAEAGLLAPCQSYLEIARIKAALTERTGLLGVGGVWGGRQMTGRWFVDGFGSEAQKAAWLGRTAAVAISEPGVGAHPKQLTTRAERFADGWRISGEKAWCSNGPIADVLIVLAITAEEAGRKRYSMFLVPRGTPGLTLKDMPGFHALRPSRHCHVRLEGCEVPTTALLGSEGAAYDRMALPFRDVEDAVGTFGTLGAFRFLLNRLRRGGEPSDDAALSLGGIVALAAVFEAGAMAVVVPLDQGRVDMGSATLVGLRLLAAEMLRLAHAHVAAQGPANDVAVMTLLGDIEATFGVARGPRLARQARLGRAGG
ncbi:MAG: acyl-CoA dehydrogenase [Acetobacteraceae bacterium]|nr:acyl-CoA dehydrogenase [Acetobacteraceae bacterium]